FSHGHILLGKLLSGYALFLCQKSTNLHKKIYANTKDCPLLPGRKTRNQYLHILLDLRVELGDPARRLLSWLTAVRRVAVQALEFAAI
ncbi:MAG: hypothetical protein OEV80_11600, partial [candidate division Zixibacteria bacterium]|nr:hypothetical protein [candidate division Zixibacteria bacterium]